MTSQGKRSKAQSLAWIRRRVAVVQGNVERGERNKPRQP